MININDESKDFGQNLNKTLTASFETLNFECIEQYLDHALNYKQGDPKK